MSEWPKQITYKDVPALEYETGTILNAATKRIMRPATHTIFDVNGENSPIDANENKRELAIKAAMRGLEQGTGTDKLAGSVYGGWETVVEAQARLALDTGKGHASTRAAEFVGKATGMLDRGAAQSASSAEPERVGKAIATELLAQLRVEQQRREAAERVAYGAGEA